MHPAPTVTRTAVLPASDALCTSNPLRAAIALALGGSLSAVLDDGGKTLIFQIDGAPKKFNEEHVSGQLMAQTDRIEREHGYISGIIREHARMTEARTRTNRQALGLSLPSKVK